jgi:hypothetical protein
MIEHGVYAHVLSIVATREQYQTAKGTAMTSSFYQGSVRFTHAPSDTHIDVFATGEGADSGDKSGNKASTGMLKYALRQTFLIETGDDPDSTPSDGQARATKASAPAQTFTPHAADGLPEIDAETGEPITESLPAGVRKFTVSEVWHTKNKSGDKSLLKVGVVEQTPLVGKFGVTVFHAPEALKAFPTWEIDKHYSIAKYPEKYPDLKYILIREPAEGKTYPDVVGFSAE